MFICIVSVALVQQRQRAAQSVFGNHVAAVVQIAHIQYRRRCCITAAAGARPLFCAVFQAFHAYQLHIVLAGYHRRPQRLIRRFLQRFQLLGTIAVREITPRAAAAYLVAKGFGNIGSGTVVGNDIPIARFPYIRVGCPAVYRGQNRRRGAGRRTNPYVRSSALHFYNYAAVAHRINLLWNIKHLAFARRVFHIIRVVFLRQIGILRVFAAAAAKRIARQLRLPAVGGAEKRHADFSVVCNNLPFGFVYGLFYTRIVAISAVYLIRSRIRHFIIRFARRKLVDGIAARRHRLRFQRFYMRARADFRADYSIQILLHRHTVYHVQLVHQISVGLKFVFIKNNVSQIFSGTCLVHRNQIAKVGITGRYKGTLCADVRRHAVFYQLHRSAVELYGIFPRRHFIIGLFLNRVRAHHRDRVRLCVMRGR